LAGRPVVGPGPDRLFLSQSCALLPSQTVLENLVAAVESVQPTASKEVCRRRAERLLDAHGLTSLARKRPSELTAAQRKRVALARTLAMNPDVLLMDDPFAGLDPAGRTALLNETLAGLASDRKTCLLATDDVNEALLLADRVVSLSSPGEADAAPPLVVDVPHPRQRRHLQFGRLHELRGTLTSQLRNARNRCDAPSSAIA
jgi:nitrate/nitrite transport system ATP-binding protein